MWRSISPIDSKGGIMKKAIKIIGTALVTSVLLAACTEERPYKPVAKIDVVSSNKFEEGVDNLLVVSNVGASRKAPVTPFEMSQGIRVQYKFTKDALLIFKMENDQRFLENSQNLTPMIKIPITHFDYKCEEDTFGDCTNREKENNDISWQDKKFFKPEFEKVETTTLITLTVELHNWIAGCYQEVDSNLVSHSIEPDALNFIIERTYRTTPQCLSQLDELEDVTFTVRRQYSIAKLESLSTPNFQPIPYTTDGKNEFGFFKTEYTKLDVDNRDNMGSEVQLMNHFANKELTYYLDPKLEKPQNIALKKATLKGIEIVNQALSMAGAQTRIKAAPGDSNTTPGDIRKNTIMLVEDPITRGLLGYGPSLTNPLTGEIIHARTVMFPGVMKQTIIRTYDEVMDYLRTQESEKISNPTQIAGSAKSTNSKSSQSNIEQIENQNLLEGSAFASQLRVISQSPVTDVDPRQTKLNYKLTEFQENQSKNLLKEVEELGKNNYYPQELVDFNAGIEQNLEAIVAITNRKTWADLSENQKQQVLDILMPFAWVPTLVHEIGHNLGLRHNFAGSIDKDNFYSKEELNNIGVKREVKYSSIMDYGYRTINELPVMGKYDIAALRFVYSRQKELTDGTLIPVNSELSAGQKIKEYSFCTDEHVELNLNCNRFDEGTNLTEIVEFLIKSYNDDYDYRYTRGQRRDFSDYSGSIRHIGYLKRTFDTLRLAFENYERIKLEFQISDDAPEWENIDWLKDLKQATKLAADFLIDVVKTPDANCLVAEASNPLQPVGIVPLTQLDQGAASCRKAMINPAYVIIGQAGKPFRTIKDRSNPYAYIDQIDVRGIWMDKLLALQTLLEREIGISNFDKYTENFLIFPGVAEKFIQTMADIMTDNLTDEMIFDTTHSGFPMDIAIPWTYSFAENDSHKISVPLHPYVSKILRLPGETTNFQVQALQIIKSETDNTLSDSVYMATRQLFGVYYEIPNGRQLSDFESYEVPFGPSIFVTQNNLIAQQIISSIIQENENPSDSNSPTNPTEEAPEETNANSKTDVVPNEKAKPNGGTKEVRQLTADQGKLLINLLSHLIALD